MPTEEMLANPQTVVVRNEDGTERHRFLTPGPSDPIGLLYDSPPDPVDGCIDFYPAMRAMGWW